MGCKDKVNWWILNSKTIPGNTYLITSILINDQGTILIT